MDTLPVYLFDAALSLFPYGSGFLAIPARETATGIASLPRLAVPLFLLAGKTVAPT